MSRKNVFNLELTNVLSIGVCYDANTNPETLHILLVIIDTFTYEVFYYKPEPMFIKSSIAAKDDASITGKLLLTISWCFIVTIASAQTTVSQPLESFTIENYYKVKWGYADEFNSLWKKNHYPLLKKAKEKGDIISIVVEKPKLHSSEDSRWDFKVTLVFKNAVLAFDPNLTTPYKKELYPNETQLAKDEQHRFELLLAHWDVMIDDVPLD